MKVIFFDLDNITKSEDVSIIINEPKLDRKILQNENIYNAYYTLVQCSNKIHGYYCFINHKNKQIQMVGYFESNDYGNNFTKPKLNLIEYKNNKSNNFIYQNSCISHNFTVFYDIFIFTIFNVDV